MIRSTGLPRRALRLVRAEPRRGHALVGDAAVLPRGAVGLLPAHPRREVADVGREVAVGPRRAVRLADAARTDLTVRHELRADAARALLPGLAVGVAVAAPHRILEAAGDGEEG